MKPDFTKIDYKGGKSQEPSEVPSWKSAEHIEVKGRYTRADLEGMEHLNYAAGIAPLPAWSLFDDVRHAALDHPSVRRILHRR